MKKQLKDTPELSKSSNNKEEQASLLFEELKTTLQYFAKKPQKENAETKINQLEQTIRSLTLLNVKELGVSYALEAVAIETNIIPNLKIIKKLDNYPSICRLIGVAYYHGFGVPENSSTAKEYYKRAAKKGDTTAMCNLGCIYDEERKHKKAVEWWSEAAKKGDSDGMYHLGMCYRNGYAKVIKKHIQTAKEWLMKSAENGNTKAIHTLASICYLEENNIKESVLWRTKALKLGCEEAAYNLGLIYEDNKSGIDQDIPKALLLYQLSSSKGNESATEEYNRLTGNYKLRILEINEHITAKTPATQCMQYLEKIDQAEDKTPVKIAFTLFINGMKENEVKHMLVNLFRIMPTHTLNIHLVEALLNHPCELVREPLDLTLKTSNGHVNQVPTLLIEACPWRYFNRATQVVSQWKGGFENATLPKDLQWLILSYIPRQGLPVDTEVVKNVLSEYRKNPENPQPLALTMVEESLKKRENWVKSTSQNQLLKKGMGLK